MGMTNEDNALRSIMHANKSEPLAANVWKAVNSIVYDICDRAGLKREWAKIDDSVVCDIKETWMHIIKNTLYAPTLKVSEEIVLGTIDEMEKEVKMIIKELRQELIVAHQKLQAGQVKTGEELLRQAIHSLREKDEN